MVAALRGDTSCLQDLSVDACRVLYIGHGKFGAVLSRKANLDVIAFSGHQPNTGGSHWTTCTGAPRSGFASQVGRSARVFNPMPTTFV